MAQIDLRHADFYIKDGYTATGAVNESSPASGDTSVTVSGFSSAIPIGAVFTVVGSTARYTVVSTVGGATPTSITFTPAFSSGAGVPANHAVVTVGPNILALKIGEGNLTFEEKRNMIYVTEKRQIALGFVMTGDDQAMDVSIDLIWEFLSGTDTDPPYPEEALNQTGQAANWVTAGADPCEPYAVNVEIVYTPPCAGVDAEVILLQEFRWESISHDTKAGTMSVKGKCKILTSDNSRIAQPVLP